MRFIGCKTQLLDKIKEVVDRHATDAVSFCDIFSGSASVARYFKQWYEIYSNDLLYFSYCLQMATIENHSVPSYELLSKKTGISDPIEYFNSLETQNMLNLEQKDRFFQNNYSPNGGRMYLNDENALRVDYCRNKVNEWKELNYINKYEFFYLVACIIEGIPYVSNIAGTYGAYNKSWDIRSNKKYQLLPLPVIDNNKSNRSFNENGAELLKHISGDILYIDPPYNERQYLPNYHVLETAAKYDYPLIKGITGQRPYEQQKSNFCSKNKATAAFRELMESARFKHIILSYNSDGIMSLDEIAEIMRANGNPNTFEVNYIPYRRFKSKSTATKTEELKEMLIYITKES